MSLSWRKKLLGDLGIGALNALCRNKNYGTGSPQSMRLRRLSSRELQRDFFPMGEPLALDASGAGEFAQAESRPRLLARQSHADITIGTSLSSRWKDFSAEIPLTLFHVQSLQ